MAANDPTPITNQRVESRGGLRDETGTFVEDDVGQPFTIQTKLGRLVFFDVWGTDGSVNDCAFTLNSATAGGSPDDPGVIQVQSGLAATKTFYYTATGF